MSIDPISDYLARQHEAILTGDRALRIVDSGEFEDAIHQTRVAVRRLRSTLRTFAPYFDPGQARQLDEELRWYAGLLGEVRDRQVLTTRLARLLNDLDESLIIGPVAARIDIELSAELAIHKAALRAQLTTSRYRQLLAAIDSLPRTETHAALPTLLTHANRTVTSRLKKATKSGDPVLLHQARKAAKRARYAAELAAPSIGCKSAAKRARHYEILQDLLGEHNDAIASAGFLRRVGAQTSAVPGESGFTFGVLHERERRAARKVRRKVRRHYAPNSPLC